LRILDSLEKPVHLKGVPKHLNPAAEFRRGDVTNRERPVRGARGRRRGDPPRAYQDYLPDFSKFFRVTTRVGTALLYELIVADQLPVRKVVVASSQAVYGEGRHRCPDGQIVHPNMRSERSPARGPLRDCLSHAAATPAGGADEVDRQPAEPVRACPSTRRSRSRSSSDALRDPERRHALFDRAGTAPVVLQRLLRRVPVFCLALHFGREPAIYEDGLQVRDFVNIHDVVDREPARARGSRAPTTRYSTSAADARGR
jgi:dTDP-L-rhamnose 4-epimerase